MECQRTTLYLLLLLALYFLHSSAEGPAPDTAGTNQGPQALSQNGLISPFHNSSEAATGATDADELSDLDARHKIIREQLRAELPGVQHTVAIRGDLRTLLNKSISQPMNVSGYFGGSWRKVQTNPLIPLPSPRARKRGTLFNLPQGKADFQITAKRKNINDESYDITGVMVLRDGMYNSQLDVRTRIRGSYRWSDGKMVLCNYYNAAPFGSPNAPNGTLPLKRTSPDPLWSQSKCLPPQTRPDGSYDDGLVRWMMLIRDNVLITRPRCLVYMELNAFILSNAAEAVVDNVGNTMGLKQVRVAHPPPFVTAKEAIIGTAEDPHKFLHVVGAVESVNCDGHLRLNTTARSVVEAQEKAIHMTLMVTATAFLKIVALVRQMEARGTQAAHAKVSMITIGLMAMLDSYECLMHLTIGFMWESVFNAFATASFFHFISFSIFGMRYLLLIWKARHPQNFQDGMNSLRRELRHLYMRFYGVMVAGLFLWFQMQRNGTLLLFLLYSFWIPQIINNAQRGCKRALSKEFIITSSIVRLAVPLYFIVCPKNFFNVKPDPQLGFLLAAWVAAQVTILHFQDKLGSRFFVPAAFLPNHYNYYQRISLPRGGDELGDCVICMCPLLDEEEGIVAGRRTHMKTPCGHWFHSHCLNDWLEIKLECPTCRTVLPEP